MRAASADKRVVEDHVIQEMGEIVMASDGRFSIACESGTYTARRAVSCLVEPAVGDRVLFAGKPSSELFVLAVLERSSDEVVVQVPGDLTLQVDRGRFAVAARDGVDLVSKAQVALTAGAVEVRASRGHVFLKHLELIGETVFGDVGSMKSVVGKVERLAKHAIERIERSYRFIEEAEHVRAGSFEVVAEDTMRIKGENAFVQAEMLVKVDGDQIHLG